MDKPNQIPPVIQQDPPQQKHFTGPVPVQSFLACCTWFTFGIALLGTTISALFPFGIAFAFIGIAPFLDQRLVVRLMPFFLVLLAIAFFGVVQGLRVGDGWPSSMPKPPTWYFVVLIVVWGAGIVFNFRRWRSSILNKKP